MNIQKNNEIIQRVQGCLNKYRNNNSGCKENVYHGKQKSNYNVLVQRDSQLKSLEQYTGRINNLCKNQKPFVKKSTIIRNVSQDNKKQMEEISSRNRNISLIQNGNNNSKPNILKKTQSLCDVKYRIISHLGKGKFADVFEGQDDSNEERVALKIIQKSIIKRYEIDHLVNQEINILKKINHPNIIKLIQVQDEISKITLVLEKCECNLYAAKQKYNFNKEQCQLFIFQIAKALAYLHDKQIIHRDIKLENILYEDESVKIGDFGLAREVPGIQYGQTQLNELCGTEGYMAPEIQRNQSYGLKADIYSFGVLIYHLMLNKMPTFKNEQLESTVGIPFPLDDLVKKCIQEDQNKRPSMISILRHKAFMKQKLQQLK